MMLNIILRKLPSPHGEFSVMSVEFTHTVLPSGSGKFKQAEYDNMESMRKNKKSIVRIQNATEK